LVRVHVHVAPDANQGSPTPVDLVFVYDETTARALIALSADEWFERKAEMRQGDPERRAFDVRQWEWVPGQAVATIEHGAASGDRRRMRAVFVFARYTSAGAHRLRLPVGESSLTLRDKDVTIDSKSPP
jgi:type VI secretion system protein